MGTGVESAEYLVASKKMADFDITLGMGWGRLAGNGDFKNPMTLFSEKFKYRPNFDGEIGGFSSYRFRGEEVGIFGGISYEIPDMPLTAILEYNPDQYDRDPFWCVETKEPFQCSSKMGCIARGITNPISST